MDIGWGEEGCRRGGGVWGVFVGGCGMKVEWTWKSSWHLLKQHSSSASPKGATSTGSSGAALPLSKASPCDRGRETDSSGGLGSDIFLLLLLCGGMPYGLRVRVQVQVRACVCVQLGMRVCVWVKVCMCACAGCVCVHGVLGVLGVLRMHRCVQYVWGSVWCRGFGGLGSGCRSGWCGGLVHGAPPALLQPQPPRWADNKTDG